MNELRPQIDPSEKGDLASQLSAPTESGAFTIKTEVPQETPISIAANDDKIRGGRGSKMAPGSLTSTLQEIRKEGGRIKHEEEDELKQINDGVKELNAAHIIFASNIATLNNKLSKNPPPGEEKRLNIMLSMAKDQMGVIEKILPINTEKKSYDSDALKTGISRFKEYEEARRKQMLAEINQLQGKISEQEVMAVRRKANYLYGEIFELTKQENEESPQEKSVSETKTINPTTMSENPQSSQPQETPTTPESVIPQTSKLNQEALDLLNGPGGAPIFKTSNLLRIAEENGVSVQGTDTRNQIIEKLQSLDNGEVVTPQVEPLAKNSQEIFRDALEKELIALQQSGRLTSDQANEKRNRAALIENNFSDDPAHDAQLFSVAGITNEAELTEIINGKNTTAGEDNTAVNSLQNEALAILENEGGKIPPLEKEPSAPPSVATANNWQDEAFEKFEKSKIVPPVENTPDILSPEEKIVGTPVSGQEEAFKKFELTAETRALLSPEQIASLEKGVAISEAEMVKEGMAARAMDKVRNVGAMWNKMPLRYKLVFSAGMIASGVGATLTGATAAVGVASTMLAFARAIGGAALFAKIEVTLKNRAESKGVPRTRNAELRHTATAAALAVLFAGIAPNLIGEGIDYFTSDTVTEAAGATTLQPGSYVEVATAGDTVWGMTKDQLQSHLGKEFTSLSTDQQTYLIDAIKDRIEENPSAFGLGENVTDIDNINIGQKIDFANALNDKEFMSSTLSGAQNFAEEEISAIPIPENTEPEIFSLESSSGTMPQQFTPGNPEVFAYTNQYVHDYINKMFGSEGIFGFGAVDGMKTPNWLDFANRPVAEIMNAQPNMTPSSGGMDVGMQNNDALAKIQQYLKVAIDETGVQPAQGESAEKFLNRAAASTFGKTMNNL